MELYLCWDEGWPRFYDPVAGAYLDNWRQERAAHEAERAAHEAERAAMQQRIRQLEAELRDRPSED